MKRLTAVWLLGALLCFPAISKAQTITDIVAQSGGEFDFNYFDYDILLNAVQTAGLADTLADPNANFTVLAPNDAAFVRLARDLGYQGFVESEAWTFLVGALTELGNGDPVSVLTPVLLYHVVDERLGFIDILLSRSITTVQGGKIRPVFLILRDNDPDIRNPKLFYPFNVTATNGIIQTINRVLLPIDLP